MRKSTELKQLRNTIDKIIHKHKVQENTALGYTDEAIDQLQYLLILEQSKDDVDLWSEQLTPEVFYEQMANPETRSALISAMSLQRTQTDTLQIISEITKSVDQQPTTQPINVPDNIPDDIKPKLAELLTTINDSIMSFISAWSGYLQIINNKGLLDNESRAILIIMQLQRITINRHIKEFNTKFKDYMTIDPI